MVIKQRDDSKFLPKESASTHKNLLPPMRELRFTETERVKAEFIQNHLRATLTSQLNLYAINKQENNRIFVIEQDHKQVQIS